VTTVSAVTDASEKVNAAPFVLMLYEPAVPTPPRVVTSKFEPDTLY
jgi:hypothetical protein